MNEQTEKLMAQAGTELMSWLKGAGDFVADQAPQLANEIATYGAIQHFVAVGFFIAACVLLAYFARRIFQYEMKESYGPEGFFIIPGIASMAAFGIAAYNLTWALTAIFAPRYYVLCTVMEMVK